MSDLLIRWAKVPGGAIVLPSDWLSARSSAPGWFSLSPQADTEMAGEHRAIVHLTPVMYPLIM